jgi:hypothetical protein
MLDIVVANYGIDYVEILLQTCWLHLPLKLYLILKAFL